MPLTLSQKIARALLIVFGIGFMLIAVRYFADPAQLTVESDVAMPSAKAVMEVRTVYGGMFFGIGLTLFAMALRQSLLAAGLWVLILIAGSVAVARLAAIALGQAPDALFAALLGTEVIGVAIAIGALRGLARPS